MNVWTKCPCCGKSRVTHLTQEQYERYMDYKNGGGHIQDLLPDLSADDMECLITGICPECWKNMMEEDEDE
ncbi:MAG: hypothetical protein Q4F83_10995 [Eubacteriales bacterium]|nr:hypothetical protein [Eubacteriales bacterium]